MYREVIKKKLYKKYITRMKYLLSLLFLISALGVARGQGSVQQIAENIKYFTAEIPSQKVFLHLDKDHYVAGEKMWYKAYLLDARTHELVSDSVNLYVELISNRGNLIKKRFLRAREGFAWGDFELGDSIPDGNYLVRAYSKPMQNKAPEFFFHKNIYISNPDYANYIALNELIYNRRFNRRLNRMSENYDISFYPEYGSLVSGIPTRVAFRATNELGQGVEFEGGKLLDGSGNKIADLKTIFPGTGIFEFTPEYGENYSARFDFEGTLFPRSYDLPGVKEEGIGFMVERADEGVRIKVVNGYRDIPSDLYLFGHIRGDLAFIDEINFEDERFVKIIDKVDLSPGVAHFAIAEKNGEVVSERLFFIKNLKEVKLDTDLEVLKSSEDSKNIELLFRDSENNPVGGNFSVTVTGVSNDKKLPYENAFSYFLLSSEFPGFVENPAHYFYDDKDLTYKALDALMMTKSWERFSVAQAISGDAPQIEYADRYGINISGTLINPINDQPVKDQSIRLRVLSGFNDTYSVNTDEEGRFSFENLVYPDYVTIELTTPTLQNRINPRLNLDVPEDETVNYFKNLYTRQQDATGTGPDWTLKLVRREPDPYRVAPDFKEAAPTYGTPDQTIYVGEKSEDFRSMLDLLTARVTGLSVRSGRLVFRDASTLMGPPPEPIFFLDGTEVGRSAFLNTSPRDVYRIEVFKGASTAIFGSRGGGGAILGYTKRGGMYGREFYEYQIAGFYTPKDFETTVDLTTIDMPAPLTEKTLLWKPDLEVGRSGRAQLSFRTPGKFDLFRVRVEGVGENGKIGSKVFYIER